MDRFRPLAEPIAEATTEESAEKTLKVKFTASRVA